MQGIYLGCSNGRRRRRPGTRLGARLRAEQLRLPLAVMVLSMSVKVFFDLTVPPVDIYSLSISGP
jgi:hypothetical protein